MSARTKGAILSAVVGLVAGLVVAHAILLLDGCGGEPFTTASAALSASDAGGELEAAASSEASPGEDVLDASPVDAARPLDASPLEEARTLGPDAGELEAAAHDAGVDVERDAIAIVDAPVEAAAPPCDPQACAACANPWIRCCAATGHCGCSLAGSVCQ